MPYVNIQVTTGVTRDQKRCLIERTTAALVEELGKAPEHIHIVIQEIDEQSWGFAGMPTDEYRAKQSPKHPAE